jgi:hypothetical protein
MNEKRKNSKPNFTLGGEEPNYLTINKDLLTKPDSSSYG